MIVIPMVGRSSRFTAAGYVRPKYELMLRGETVFSHAVRSFERYFADTPFVFMVRGDVGAAEFVAAELDRLGLADATIRRFAQDTRGQAETVFLGLEGQDGDAAITIFNIDTFRPGFALSARAATCDGYLEVFHGPGEHWSFVAPGADGRVLRTTEKERISDLCCDGLYHFREKRRFDAAYLAALRDGDMVRGEYYVAPLYNRLIADGGDIRYEVVDAADIAFCGTPAEYEALLAAG